MKQCPRCKEFTLRGDPLTNATSRRDNKTAICSFCGMQEAFEDSSLIPRWLDNPKNMPYWDTDSPVWHTQMERQQAGLDELKALADEEHAGDYDACPCKELL